MRNIYLKFALLPVLILLVFTTAAPKADALFDQLLSGITGGNIQNVRIIGNTSEPAITTALNSTLSKLLGEETSDLLQRLLFKEEVLDPAAWAAAKQFQQQLTGETLKWLGGQQPGQNGQPPFIQNLGVHYQGIADQVAGDFIFGDELSGLCSEEEVFQVKQQVLKNHLEQRRQTEGGAQVLHCTEEADENPNSLSAILKKTTSCSGTLCGTYKGEKVLAERTLNAIANENRVLDWSDGMNPQRVCKTINGPDGKPQRLCEIVSPPSLAADYASFNTVQLPGLQLLNMDEFSEVASNLMNNLSNLVNQGITGVLGLSGNPNYSVNVFGPDGILSYVDALVQEDVTNYQTGGGGGATGDFLTKALSIETGYLRLQQEILNELVSLENKLADNRQEFPGCFDMELSPELKAQRDKSTAETSQTLSNIEILTTLQERYDGGDSAVRNAVVTEFNQRRPQFHTEYDIQNLKLTVIDLTFAQLVDKFRYDMASERQSCGGSFDYQGTLTS